MDSNMIFIAALAAVVFLVIKNKAFVVFFVFRGII